MDGLTAFEKAKRLIHAYYRGDLSRYNEDEIYQAACEYIGLEAVIKDCFDTNASFHGCISNCRYMEKRINYLYDTYLLDDPNEPSYYESFDDVWPPI